MIVTLMGLSGCAGPTRAPGEVISYVQCEYSTGFCEEAPSGTNPIQFWAGRKTTLRGSLGEFDNYLDLPELLAQHRDVFELTGAETFHWSERKPNWMKDGDFVFERFIHGIRDGDFVFERFIHGIRLGGYAAVHRERTGVTSITGVVSAKHVQPPSTSTIDRANAVQLAEGEVQRTYKLESDELEIVGKPELMYCNHTIESKMWYLCWQMYARTKSELLEKVIVDANSGNTFVARVIVEVVL